MANYDFRSLSPHDFELLCRDLLQEEIGIRLESFSTGPDSGIDFRYRADREYLIVQCKHYVDSGFDALRRALSQREVGKLEDLNPTRYILTTSVSLTPRRKEVLLEILKPHCGNTGDILGREDVNNLLGIHPEVEQKHFKLWLTSSAVLERVLQSGIFSDTENYIERIRSKLSRYVPNKSFLRAKGLLEDKHFCIIVGIPGIGKTTLAQVLLADLVDRHGFKAFRIGNDLSELRPVKNPKSRQVFYFDDFLGKTSIDKLQKNEDQRIVELMEEVATNPNWRFILTTREYILNVAKQRYEAFAHPSINLTTCIVSLNDYSWEIRARILYNHIYFSDLSRDHKLALLERRGYQQILSHNNYNPRIIEYMTESRIVCPVSPPLYRKEFIDSLNNPERIWDHAFRYQISESARHLLLVLATLPYEIRLEDLEEAFWAFYMYRRERFGFSTTAGDFENGMKELDANLIRSTKIGDQIVVSFHSPSVRDFMEGFLESSDSDVVDLAQAACFFEQFTSLWNGIKGRRYNGVQRDGGKFVQLVATNLHASSAQFTRVADSQGEIIELNVNPPSNESRAEFFFQVAEGLQVSANPIAESVLVPLEKGWQEGKADREDLVSLLKVLTQRGLSTDDPQFSAARSCLLSCPEELEDFRAAIRFFEEYPEEATQEDREQLKSQFRALAEEYSEGLGVDDPDWLREIASDLASVGSGLQVDTDPFTQSLYERAEEIESERAEDYLPEEYDEDWREDWGSMGGVFQKVHQIFDGLRNDLMDR